jgi:hypothetical protein
MCGTRQQQANRLLASGHHDLLPSHLPVACSSPCFCILDTFASNNTNVLECYMSKPHRRPLLWASRPLAWAGTQRNKQLFSNTAAASLAKLTFAFVLRLNPSLYLPCAQPSYSIRARFHADNMYVESSCPPHTPEPHVSLFISWTMDRTMIPSRSTPKMNDNKT